jgi:hypothetical protein
MSEEIFRKLGLETTDFEEKPKSESDLIESVTTSGRLYRKAVQHLILKDLRIYFDKPQLTYTDDFAQHFKYWGRKRRWAEFKDSMEFKVPKLRTENIAIVLMATYLVFYGYSTLKLLSKYSDFFVHVAGLIFLGALIPFLAIFSLGQTELPAKNVDGLVDKIIQENMYDLLADNKEGLKRILRKEIGAD